MRRKVLASIGLIITIATWELPRTAAATPIFVDTGTPASCTEEVLQDSLNTARDIGGGMIKLECGPNPVVITLSGATEPHPEIGPIILIPPHETTIDGDGMITLNDLGDAALVFMAPDRNVVLKSLNINSFGLRYLVINQGTLTFKNSTVSESVLGFDNAGPLTQQKSIVSDMGGFIGTGIVNSGTLYDQG